MTGIIAMFVPVFFLLAVFVVFWLRATVGQPVDLLTEDAAFEGTIDYHGLTPARIKELKPFVDRAGIMSRGIRETRSRFENSDVVETFDVFVIDVNGAIHDVAIVDDLQEAARIAREVAVKLEIPLDDPDSLLV